MANYDELNELIEKSKDVQVDDYDQLEDGVYEAEITNCEITESKKGDSMIKFEFTVIEGKFEGRKVWKYTVLNSPENMKRARTDFEKFDLMIEDVDQLENACEEIIDEEVELTIKTKVSTKNGEKKSYTNVSIKLLEE